MAKLISVCILCGYLFASLSLCAQQKASTEVEQATDSTQQTDTDQTHGFALLEDLPTKNQIPLFENRFRVDEKVEEITLLLFRKRGTASVVLVQPDGSKLYFNRAEEQKIRWHDASSYDLIQIKNPMPGPWQVVGRLLPESRIMLLTEIRLNVEPLPANLMVGETVKITARLTNGDKPITAKEFNEVLSMEVIFVSTNNAEYDNFGRGVVQVANFRDDGKGYDERSRDGVFTGEFQLGFASGEWIPKYIVRTPLYTREVEQAPVVLKPAPIVAEISVSPAIADDQPQELAVPHQVLFSVTDEAVDAMSVLLQGRVRYPDGQVGEFALNEPGSSAREVELLNLGHGSYILEVSVFGKVRDGREFMLDLPDISFVVNRPVAEAPVLEELPEQIQRQIAAEQAEPESEFPWGLVIGANIFILLGGGGAIWFVMTGRQWTALIFWRKKAAEDKAKTNTAPPASAAAEKTKANAQKNDDMDDILDLTLPDD